MSENLELNRYVIASASTRDYDQSTKIWRYLTFDKFTWLLENSKLWHTRLDFLNDRFEGSFTCEHVRKRDAGELPDYLKSGLPVEIEKARNKSVIYTNFATCWHASKYESPAMWKLYATEHAGVAIVSSPLRMHESVDLSAYGPGIISPVEYKDFQVEDMLLKPLSKSFGRKAVPGLLKQKFFEHENEIRGLIHWVDHAKLPTNLSTDIYADALRKANPPGIGLNVDLKRMIEEIYISPLAPRCFKEVVEIVSARHELSDRIHVSKLLGEPRY